MARNVSTAFREAFWAQGTDKVALLLLDVSVETTPVPFRFCLNTEKVRQNPDGISTAVNNSSGYTDGATALTVDSTAGFSEDDPVTIAVTDSNGLANWFDTIITVTDATTLTLDVGLEGTASDNAVIKKYRDYSPYPFELELPGDAQGQLPQVKLKIDNITREISDTLRNQTVSPMVKLYIVLADTPDVIEYETPELSWVMTEIDSMFIQGTLSGPQILNSSYPQEDFSPSTYPSLFRT